MNGNTELMNEWFKKADHDLLNAEIILESGRDSLSLDTVCFHCQQAVEKYLKGFLVCHNIEFARTHFLGTLLDQCKSVDETFEELDDVIELNAYAVDVPIEDVDLESLSLSTNPRFLAIIERSRANHKPGTGMNSDEVRRHLGHK